MTPARALLLAALIALPISVGLTYLPFWSIATSDSRGSLRGCD
jgi:hypothetical protein